MSETNYKIVWAPAAVNDLDDTLEYIAQRDCVDAAIAVYQKVIGQIESLTTHPQRCRIPHELNKIGVSEYRELVVRPYGVFFRVQNRNIAIVAILDRRRDMEELLLQRLIRNESEFFE
jgi:toxin ParE1/3/4